MCLCLRWGIWETVIVGKYLEATEIELETDKISIWGCWVSLRKVTSLKEWLKKKLYWFQKHYSLREYNWALPHPLNEKLWSINGGPGLQKGCPWTPRALLTIDGIVRKELILTHGSSGQIIICQFCFKDVGRKRYLELCVCRNEWKHSTFLSERLLADHLFTLGLHFLI